MLLGTQVLGALIAESMASVEQHVTMPQLRVLLLARAEPPVNLTTVARDLRVHPSNATRTCDRLVAAGLLDRRTSERDRRQVELSLTPTGRRLVTKVMRHRRRRIRQLMGKMSAADRAALARSLRALADAGHPDT
ncbi:MAG TPA: MarR family transcriptional regulator [Nocardioidaceae bacterium]|nr:MarR family transcriptional regulator [Nocardioidaceae bacterium]